MVRRLGIKRWQRLHQAIYLIALLVLIHYFLRFIAAVHIGKCPGYIAGRCAFFCEGVSPKNHW
jgi:DMSO/TMAO reductase YedYZ heme-binding membrane subunit